MLNKIIKVCIYLSVFLTPFFFLPFSVEALEFNKGYLLFFLTTVGLLAWLAKMIFKDRRICFQRTPLDFPVFVFLLVMVMSTFLSVDKTASLIGFYGRFWPNLIGILSLGIFYFLVTNNVQFREAEPPKEVRVPRSPKIITVRSLIKTFLWSSFFVTLAAYFSIFGIWSQLSKGLTAIHSSLALPSFMLTSIFNPASGSLQGLAVFLSIVVVLLIGLFAYQKVSGKRKFALSVLFIAQAVLLCILDFWQAWLIILISLGLFLAFSLWRRLFKENVNQLTLPIFFFIIAVCFLFLNPLQDFLPPNALSNLPQEVLLSQSASWKVGFTAFWKNPVLGTGPATFGYDFSKYKPDSFMQSSLWSLRFDRPASHLAEVLGTGGILGILSYLFILGWFLMISWFILTADSKGESAKKSAVDPWQIPLLITFVALVLSQIFYYQNTTLAFCFFLFMGLGVSSWQKPVKEKTYTFKDFPEIGLVFNCCFWVLMLGFLVLYVMAGKFYMADTFYRQQLLRGGTDLTYLGKAVRWAGQRMTYRLALANSYRALVNQEVLKPVDEIDQQALVLNAAQAISQGQAAVAVNPNMVAAWEIMGIVYRDVRGIAEGASEWAVKSFNKALELEPKNPAVLTELGKLKKDEGKNEEARNFFARAVAFRGSYFEAELQTALLDEAEGEIEKATAKLEDLKKQNPLSTEVHFQLGRLYYNQNKLNSAISEFEQVLILFPNHSNTHYSLGLAYERQGKIQAAIEEFKKVLQLNPGNESVKAKIRALQGGQ